MIRQNNKSSTIVIFRWVSEGLGATLSRMLHVMTTCQRKKYYFILDNKNFGPFEFTHYFNKFWDENENRIALNNAKHIHLLLDKPSSFSLPAHADIIYHPHENLCHRSLDDSNEVSGEYSYDLFFNIDQGISTEVFKLNNSFRYKIDELQSELNLPEHYQAIQIRRGDKAKQLLANRNLSAPKASEFIQKLNPEIQAVFVATDEPSVIDELHQISDFTFYSLASKNSAPHTCVTGDQDLSMTYALLDIEICRNAAVFVGSDSAFSGLIKHLRRDTEKDSQIIKWADVKPT